MALKDKIEQIELEIADGKLGIARDRLHGLLNSYPRELFLRAKLGEVYWKLGYPVQAGRFWYLESERTEVMNLAIEKFVNACARNPEVILRQLKVHGVPREVVEAANEEHLRTIARAQIDLDPLERPEFASAKRKTDFAFIGCVIGFILLAASVIHSIIDLVKFVSGAK